MSNLVPERRPDKNGRMVTRHVLPVTTEPKRSSRIPAPVVKEQDRGLLVSSLTASVSKQMGFTRDDYDEWYGIQGSLEEYSDRTLDRLSAAWKQGTQISSAIALMVFHSESEEFIREFATFGGIVSDNTTGMNMAMSFVRSLHHYKQLPQVDDYSAADEKTKDACRSLIVLAERLRDARKDFGSDSQPIAGIRHDYDSYDTPVIQSEGLVQLVVDRPEDVDRIGDIAILRRTTDATAIVEVMDADIKSLSSGVL